MDTPKDQRTFNIVPANSNYQLGKEGVGPCLKDAFKDILLVVVYNYPFYDSIPHLSALYRPAFPHLLFCGPPHNTTRSGILTVNIYRGILGYECLGRAIREHPGLPVISCPFITFNSVRRRIYGGVTWGSVIDQSAKWEATFFFSFLRPVL